MAEQGGVHGDRGQSDQATGNHWSKSIAGSVKRARVQALPGPETKRQREPEKIQSCFLRIGEGKVATPVDQIDQRRGCRHHETGGQQRSGDDAVDRSIHSVGELSQALLSKKLREKRQRSLAGGLP